MSKKALSPAYALGNMRWSHVLRVLAVARSLAGDHWWDFGGNPICWLQVSRTRLEQDYAARLTALLQLEELLMEGEDMSTPDLLARLEETRRGGRKIGKLCKPANERARYELREGK